MLVRIKDYKFKDKFRRELYEKFDYMETEFSEIRKQLSVVYYAQYGTYLLLVILFGYLLKDKETFMTIDPLSQTGQIVSYAVIMYVIASIPGALWWFKKQMKKMNEPGQEIAMEEKKKRYTGYASIRMALIGLGAVMAIIAFYYLGNNQPMLWCAGIAIVAQFFCKPSDRKIYLEINNKTEDDL